MHAMLPPSQVAKHKFDFEMREPVSPKTQDDFRMLAPLSPEPQASGMRVPLSYGGPAQLQRGDAAQAGSLLLHAKDFEALAEEGASQIGAHQPTKAIEPLGSSSIERREFHITISHIRLTLAHTGWIWGEYAPSHKSSKHKGQPGTIEEVESNHELVC
jgi:hypothetical protein